MEVDVPARLVDPGRQRRKAADRRDNLYDPRIYVGITRALRHGDPGDRAVAEDTDREACRPAPPVDQLGRKQVHVRPYQRDKKGEVLVADCRRPHHRGRALRWPGSRCRNRPCVMRPAAGTSGNGSTAGSGNANASRSSSVGCCSGGRRLAACRSWGFGSDSTCRRGSGSSCASDCGATASGSSALAPTSSDASRPGGGFAAGSGGAGRRRRGRRLFEDEPDRDRRRNLDRRARPLDQQHQRQKMKQQRQQQTEP